jgi:hypothetical protein
MLAFLFVLLQLVVSAKAGLIHAVYGEATATVGEQMRVGKALQTGPRSHAEIQLTPAAYMRLDEDSTVVLDSADLDHVIIRVTSGTVLIAAKDLDSGFPIHVIAGDLHALVLSKGLYRFSSNTAEIVDGRLSPADTEKNFRKGSMLRVEERRYIESALPKDADSALKKFLGEPKAGFVNAVVGQVNVKLHDQMREGQTIRTGPGGRVEVVVGTNEFLRLDENSAVVFDAIKLMRNVYRLTPGGPRGGDDGSGVMMVNERLRPVFRVSGTALLEQGGRLFRFIDNAQFGLSRAASTGTKETWLPVRGGIQTTSRGIYNSITMDPDALDKWSETRAYELARATQMAYYADTPRQTGWIYSPQINGLAFLPGTPNRNAYGYTAVPLFPVTTPVRGAPPLRGRGGRGGGRGEGGRGEGGDRGGPR